VGVFHRLAGVISGRTLEERLTQLERTVRKIGEAGRDRATTTDARLQEISRAVADQPTAKDLRELRQALRGVAAPAPAQTLFETLERIASSDRPVLIGPWTGEVGFELLYWIPFLEWARARWQLQPEREIVVSRGGVASWYRQSADRYIDILSLFSPDEFRVAVSEEKRKHRQPGAFDARVTEAIGRRQRLEEIDTLHPGMMFRAFAPYWSDEAGYALIDQFTRPRLMEAPTVTVPVSLPSDYVAVRFYFSECFPATQQNRDFVRHVVASLAERHAVVLLNPGVMVDEHTDWLPQSGDRILTIGDGLAADRNLEVQSAVIAGARAFVGTYGGYAYLAPLYRVPAVAFYSQQSFKLCHLHAAQRAFSHVGAAELLPIDVAQAGVLQAALAALVST
jgi:hypothetical protein